MNAAFGGWALSSIWCYNSGEPFSIISGLGTLNRAARSTTTNTADIGNTTLSALNVITNGVYMTGNGPYFISPSAINPADGRGAEFGSTFSGEVFSNPPEREPSAIPSAGCLPDPGSSPGTCR